MLSETYMDSEHFFRRRPQVLIRNLLFKNALNQRKEVCTRESRAHCFPKLVRTVKTEVLVNDDVTVSDLGRDDVSLPPCIVKFVFLILTSSYSMS